MADVTVKQLAQLVGLPVERLFNRFDEAGLTFTDENQTVNEDQKRILLNFLNRSRESRISSERITLKRKSLTKVTLGLGKEHHHQGKPVKPVNVKFIKTHFYIQRTEPVEPELLESTVELNEPMLETADVETKIAEAELSEGKASINEEAASEASKPLEAQEAREGVIEPAQGDEKKPPKVERSFEEKPSKKKFIDKEVSDTDRGEFKKGKKKPRYEVAQMDEEDVIPGRFKRARPKKRKSFEKSDKVREAEESLTHGFAMPTSPVIREVAIPETITVAELAKRMSV